MEDLQGGTLALEHRYDLDTRVREYALVTVYRGTQQPFDRPVWVKVCDATHTYSSPDVYERIKASIVAAASFRHPRVPELVDFGDIDTHLAFWVTKRIDGTTTLDEYVERQGTLTPDEALEITLRVGEVVIEAHDHGVVHGGIAPRWISIDDDGVTIDHFAIHPTMAEIRQLDGVILSEDVLWSLPPEQFDEKPTEHAEAADIWALGALLYWMLAGVHPYLDDPTDTSEAVLRLRSGAPAGSLADLGFDASLSAYVEKALSPNPEDRFASVRSMLEAAPVAEEAPPAPAPQPAPEVAPPPSPDDGAPKQGGIGTALAGVLVLLVLSNLAWLFYSTSQEEESHSTSLPSRAPEILPVGIELDTEPDGATILRVDGADETEFGDTPLTLDPKALPEGQVPLIVRKRGHRDVRLDVKAVSDGHRLIVHLPPEGEQAATASE